METGNDNFSGAALVIAHPSHELRIHGWLQSAHPRVFVLTDGSGRGTEPRLPATTKVLNDLGAQPGSIFGRITDAQVYEAFLRSDFPFFIQLADELATEFERAQIEYVVADAAEGYSPTHDVCRLLTDAAVAMIKRRHQRHVHNFDYAVVDSPDECPAATREQAIWIKLDDEAFARKVEAARGYNAKLALDIEAALRGEPFQGVRRFSEPQLVGEVDKDLTALVRTALRAYPETEARVKHVMEGIALDRFRVECLRPVSASAESQTGSGEMPFYELYGDKLVAAGRYQKTITYSDHFKPLAEAVWRHVAIC